MLGSLESMGEFRAPKRATGASRTFSGGSYRYRSLIEGRYTL